MMEERIVNEMRAFLFLLPLIAVYLAFYLRTYRRSKKVFSTFKPLFENPKLHHIPLYGHDLIGGYRGHRIRCSMPMGSGNKVFLVEIKHQERIKIPALDFYGAITQGYGRSRSGVWYKNDWYSYLNEVQKNKDFPKQILDGLIEASEKVERGECHP